MAKRKIVWTRTADLQFVGVLEYWLNRNKSNTYSKKLILEVSKRTKQIAENPFIYTSTDFKDVRVASVGNFSIFFKVAEKQIVILAFWDNRQDPKKLLNFLRNR
jgi:plasmid stabilization system protein ParE